MQAGQLDRIISLERATVAVDSYGAAQQTWVTFAFPRAQLLTNATKEQALKSYGEETDIARVFRIRYLDNVTLADRLIYNTEAYRIVDIKEIGRREALEIGTLRVTV